ncbi:MAG TPA: lipopolysaccharide assembly protein LapB [Plasticicumulans sp.]|nr:lipopolysaccharide assembly protein LapB [Plasticicumulans sp.]
MLELLWLLLPVAAASGWWAAARSLERKETPPNDVFRGLNYLLDEKPDRAIEVFGRMVEADPDAVDIQLTLGSLFRRRGEVDRALHIHSELLRRAQLTDSQRGRARLELGEDYLRAGLFDRAEQLFSELLELPDYRSRALVRLLSIYEQEREWQRALDACDEVERATGTPMRIVAAHYCCELAEEAVRASDRATARSWLDRALVHDERCARAAILRGRLELSDGNPAGALDAYTRVVTRAPEYLPEVLGPLQRCYAQLHRQADWVTLLRGLVNQYHVGSVTGALAQALREREGPEAALVFLEAEVAQHPSTEGLRTLIDLRLAAEQPARAGDLELLLRIGRQVTDLGPRYRCDNCGFVGRTLHWSCPSCKRWNTVKPIPDRLRRNP